MNDREAAAVAAGLKHMELLKLHSDDVPIDVVLKDLKGRFGRHPTAFHQDPRNMSSADFNAARTEMLANLVPRLPGALATVDARTLTAAEYAGARDALFRNVRR